MKNSLHTWFNQFRKPSGYFILALSAGLAGCGGDGGGDTTSGSTTLPSGSTSNANANTNSNSNSNTSPATSNSTSTVTSASLQGRWVTDSSASTAYTVIALPVDNAASTSTQAWALAQDGSSLAQLTIDNTSQVQGTFFNLKGSVAPVAISGIVSLNSSLNPKTLSLPGLSTTGSAVLTQSDTLVGNAVLADMAGSWKGSVSDGAKTVSWTLTTSATKGELAGTSSTGCVYSGSLTPINNAKAFTTVFSESCSDGSAAAYNGISTISPEGTRLSTVAVANGRLGSQAIALLLSR